jgi:uncharacterized protein YbjT (DUF2867 family)
MILITGATGNNGLEIVKLLSQMRVPCRALVRTKDKARVLEGIPGVELASGDFADPDSLAPALAGIDRALLISSADPRLPQLQANFIHAAKTAGVPYVVKFSGAWAMGGADLREWRFARWHADAEKILEDSGLFFTHLQPNQFMQVYLRFQPTIAAQGKFFAACRDSRVSPVDIRDIAAVAAAVLTGSGHEGKSYLITGPESLTYSEIADKLSIAIGKKVTYVDVPLEQARKAMVDSGAPDWFVAGQMEQYQVRLKGYQAAVTTVVSEVAKKEPIPFDQFARDHASYFRGGQAEPNRGGA